MGMLLIYSFCDLPALTNPKILLLLLLLLRNNRIILIIWVLQRLHHREQCGSVMC